MVNYQTVVVPSKEANFFIKYNGTYILYNPLRKKAYMIDDGLKRLLQSLIKNPASKPQVHNDSETTEIIQILENDDIFSNFEIQELTGSTFLPTDITLFPTSDCNLRCVYRYGNAGEIAKFYMSFDVAKSAIDFIINNALFQEVKGISVNFHGGGEPFSHFDLMKQVVDYGRNQAKKHKLESAFSLSTNGVITDEQREWIVNNQIGTQISFDGPDFVQNVQRPDKNGNGTYNKVLETIQFLREKKHHFNIRATATRNFQDQIPEIIQHILDVTGVPSVHYEPLEECGRCSSTGCVRPDAEVFLKHTRAFIDNDQMSYSGGDTQKTVMYFCGAAGRNFCVTPDGWITTCYEVACGLDKRMETFGIGKYNQVLGKFEFFEEKIQHLRNPKNYITAKCKKCFARWHCAGDCLAKTITDNGDFTGKARCQFNREIVLGNILYVLNGGESNAKICKV